MLLNIQMGYRLQALDKRLGFILVLLSEEIQVHRNAVTQVKCSGTAAGKIKGLHQGLLTELFQESPGGRRKSVENLNLAIHAVLSTNRHSGARRKPENSDAPLDVGSRLHDGN